MPSSSSDTLIGDAVLFSPTHESAGFVMYRSEHGGTVKVSLATMIDEMALRRVAHDALGGTWDARAFDILVKAPDARSFIAREVPQDKTSPPVSRDTIELLAYKYHQLRVFRAGCVVAGFDRQDWRCAQEELELNGPAVGAAVIRYCQETRQQAEGTCQSTVGDIAHLSVIHEPQAGTRQDIAALLLHALRTHARFSRGEDAYLRTSPSSILAFFSPSDVVRRLLSHHSD